MKSLLLCALLVACLQKVVRLHVKELIFEYMDEVLTKT